jgi:serine/threonine-protein kinase
MSTPSDAADLGPHETATDDPEAAVELPRDHPQRLDRYRLCFELAAGGMATVYLAREEGKAGVERVVALKCIHRHLSRNRNFIEMFLDEARIATRINHPNVCSVYDFGEVDGTYYIAMEYLLGENFARLFRRLAKQPEHTRSEEFPFYAARIIADACEGLHAAHELRGDAGEPLNVVHRDVSLHNLFVNYDGSVRVVDFGIARAAGQLHETRSGQLKGKLAYVAPEQIQKQPVDRRADVWSLGVVLWELLTGKRLFKRESDVDTILAVVQDPVRPPSRIRSSVPEELDTIVLSALARKPEDRYATARELGRDLSRVLAQRGKALGMPEIEEWMHSLFSAEHEQRLELVEQVRTMGGETVPDAEIPPGLRDTEADVSAVVEKSPAPGRKRWMRRGGWLFGAVGLGAAAVGVAVIDGGPAERTQSGEEPASTSPVERASGSGSERARGGANSQADSDSTARANRDSSSVGGADRADATPSGVEIVAPRGRGTRVRSDAGKPQQSAATSERTPADQESRPEPGQPEPGQPERERRRAAKTEQSESQDKAAQLRRARRRARRTSQAAQSADAVPGTVTLITIGGWADVYLHGRRVGRTPTQLELEPGTHTLELKPFGREPALERRTRLESGEKTRMVVRVEP